MNEEPREWTRYAVFEELGLQALRARFHRHAYGRHTHDAYVLGVVHHGAVAFRYRGSACGIAPGALMLLDPEEAHDGRPASHAGFLKSVIYVPPSLMERALADAVARARPVAFAQPTARDDEIAAGLTALCDAILCRAGRLEIESELMRALVLLAARHGTARQRPQASGRVRAAVARAREYLHANFAADVALDDLACAAALSRFHLVRAFASEVGLTPHAYQTRLRLEAARRAIDRGDAAARVASDVGFADQSHLIRRFKRAYGITPQQYAASKNVQDRR